MSALLVPLPFILIEEPYELMEIDFIGPFKKLAYGNIYIYNLVDYFSRHIYPHFISGNGINKVIILFNYYLQANSKLYIIYMDANSHFISQKLHRYFQKKDIAIICTYSTSYKPTDIIEKSIYIL